MIRRLKLYGLHGSAWDDQANGGLTILFDRGSGSSCYLICPALPERYLGRGFSPLSFQFGNVPSRVVDRCVDTRASFKAFLGDQL
jgi:hypothetical protein